MYLLDTEVTINWELLPYTTAPALADLHLVIIDPNNISKFLESPIGSEDYTPPTETTNGQVFYRITPDIPGLWKTGLVIGSPDNYLLLSEVDMFVFGRIQNTPSYRVPIGGEELLIGWQLTDWDNVEGELGFWEFDRGSGQWTTTSENTSTGFFVPVNGWNVGYRKSSVRVVVSAIGSELPNDLTTLTITDGVGTVLAFKEVLPSTTPTGYAIDEVMNLSYPTDADIEHLRIYGSKTYNHVFTEELEGFILTSRPYAIEFSDSLDITPAATGINLRPTLIAEPLDIRPAVTGITLNKVVQYSTYTVTPESMDIQPAVTGITLTQLVQYSTHTVAPENIDIRPAVTGITLTKVAGYLTHEIAPESMDIRPAVTGITLTKV